MSLFDFPRINFAGKSQLNVGTANNGFYIPLVIYEPDTSKALLPPRLYIDSKLLIDGLSIDEFYKLLPAETLIFTDAKRANMSYIEINAINTEELFLAWAVTKLGEFPADFAYWKLYESVKASNTGQPLCGDYPAYWNYYGDMSVILKNVQVKGVTFCTDPSSSPITIDEQSANVPKEIASVLGASLTYNNVLNDDSTSTALLVDTDPTTSLATQVFATKLTLHKENINIMGGGSPSKASSQNINPFKILFRDNVPGVTNASANFFCVIPTEALEGGEASPILDIFKLYGSRPADLLRGVCVRYTFMELWENQNPDYAQLGTQTNPALNTYSGSITPYYEGDMKSVAAGRYLANLGQQPIFGEGSSAIAFNSLVCQVDDKRNIISYDLLNVIPEIQNTQTNLFETYGLGTLLFEADYLCNGQMLTHTLGEINLTEATYSRSYVLKSGGMLDLPITFSPDFKETDLQNATLAVSFLNSSGEKLRILQEIATMVYSDQVNAYAEQGADPSKGYRVYSADLEPITLRIFQRGLPATTSAKLTGMCYKVQEGGLGYDSSVFVQDYFSDGDSIIFPIDEAQNAIYYFYPEGTYSTQPIVYNAFDLNSFFNVRILPKHDYGKYLDPYHAEYPTEVTFDVLYKEIFQTYSLIFPAMSLILPFTKENWDNPTMAAMLRQRIDLKYWATGNYMPRTRDMSADQIALVIKWASKFEQEPLIASRAFALDKTSKSPSKSLKR